MSPRPPKTLTWYQPRWSYVPQLWDTLFTHLLNARTLSRIVGVSLVVGGLLVIGVKWWVPGIQLPPLWQMLFVFPALVFLMLFQTLLLTIIPPSVAIRRKQIVIAHGQHATGIPADQIIAAWLTFHAGLKIRLKIRFHGRKAVRTVNVGVSPKIDFQRLNELMPVEVIVRDARARSGAPHSTQQPTE